MGLETVMDKTTLAETPTISFKNPSAAIVIESLRSSISLEMQMRCIGRRPVPVAGQNKGRRAARRVKRRKN